MLTFHFSEGQEICRKNLYFRRDYQELINKLYCTFQTTYSGLTKLILKHFRVT
jgi:hypothetical protein